MLAADAGAAVSDSGAVVSQSTAEVAPVQSSVCTVDESATKSIVFIDAGVEDIDALSSGVIDSSTEIVFLSGKQDGIRQVSRVLEGRSNIGAIHFVAHGSDGVLQLGNTRGEQR